MTYTRAQILAAADAIRAEMATFRLKWFAGLSPDEPLDMTPFTLLAEVALRAAERVVDEQLKTDYQQWLKGKHV